MITVKQAWVGFLILFLVALLVVVFVDAYNQASLDRTSYFVPRSASGCRCGYILAACYRCESVTLTGGWWP